MTRAPLVVASTLVVTGLLVAAWIPANSAPADGPTTLDDPRLATLSNSVHDMPSARQRLEARGVDVSASGLMSLAEDVGADLGDRYNALLALAEIDDPAVEPILLRTLDAHDADLRYAAVVALRDHGGRKAEGAVLRALDDPAEGVRSIAIASLATLGGPRAARTLAGRLDMGLLVGYQAVDAAVTLGEIGQPVAAPALHRAFADSLAGECPPEADATQCLALHLEAATGRDELPIATDCPAAAASAADLRAAASGALVRLGEPSLRYLVLAALHPCTSNWLRTDVVDRLGETSGRSFAPPKRTAEGASDESTPETLHNIATWWQER